jgi:hypothetical protein
MSEELQGPKKSKDSLRKFEGWLLDSLEKGPMSVDEVCERYQYLSGHEPRKIMQYMRSINRESGTIKLYTSNSGDECVKLNKAHPEQELSPKEKIDAAIEEKAHIKSKMKAGPCKSAECPPFSDDCRNCTAYTTLKNKEFLEEKESATEYMRRDKEKEENMKKALRQKLREKMGGKRKWPTYQSQG